MNWLTNGSIWMKKISAESIHSRKLLWQKTTPCQFPQKRSQHLPSHSQGRKRIPQTLLMGKEKRSRRLQSLATSQKKTVLILKQIPTAGPEKLEIDVHSGVIEISERSDVSQIQVNISDPLNATQCFMDEDTLEISRETGGQHRRRDGSGNRNDTPVIEIILPKDHSIFQLSLDLGTAACTVSDLTVLRICQWQY